VSGKQPVALGGESCSSSREVTHVSNFISERTVCVCVMFVHLYISLFILLLKLKHMK
jgi:hypothetical protein